MIIGNAAWGFRETPLEKQLAITKSMGCSILELHIASIPADLIQMNATDTDITRVKSLFAANNIRLDYASIGNDFTSADEKQNYAALDAVKKKIDIAAKLGVKGIRIFAGFSAAKDVIGKRWNVMIDCLNKAAEYANPKGIFLAIETHGGVKKTDAGFIHMPSASTGKEPLARMMNEIHPSLAFNYDPANVWAAERIAPENVLSIIRPRVKYVHLKDYRVVKDDVVMPVGCGEGVLDWNTLLRSLTDYDGPAFIEYEPTEDVEDGCKRSLMYLKHFTR
ncbi:MAG: sugar phosphate isomerase/epimerase family protein [Spirochaetota bacterium]